MKKRFTDEQIIGVLREAEVGATSIKALCRKHDVTEQTFFRWRNKLGGLDVPDARRRAARTDACGFGRIVQHARAPGPAASVRRLRAGAPAARAPASLLSNPRLRP